MKSVMEQVRDALNEAANTGPSRNLIEEYGQEDYDELVDWATDKVGVLGTALIFAGITIGLDRARQRHAEELGEALNDPTDPREEGK